MWWANAALSGALVGLSAYVIATGGPLRAIAMLALAVNIFLAIIAWERGRDR